MVLVVVLVAPLVFRAPSGPAAVCAVGPGRPLAVRAASFARRVVSKPGQAPPPPTGTAADPSGALHACGALQFRMQFPGLYFRSCNRIVDILRFWACVDSCTAGIACEICESEAFLTSVGLRVGGTVAGRRMSCLRVPHLGSQTMRRPPRQPRSGASERLAPVISHVIPWRLLQTLNSPRCNCNVFGWSPKVTAGNYVRFLSGLALPLAVGMASGFSASAFTKMLVAARHTPDREDSTSSDRVESSR